jgi:GDPmannose 4,6-dehydratase
MSKRTLILGVNGQDGILLSNLLLNEGCVVFGIGKSPSLSADLNPRISYFPMDIRNTAELIHLIRSTGVEVIYNLSGISSVAYSFENPAETFEVNTIAVTKLLEGIHSDLMRNLRFYQASSSEMFGVAQSETQDESTPFNPVSPYAESKVATHLICRELRREGAFVSSGILFNHESIYRPRSFVTRKITYELAQVALGLKARLALGNLTSERDWGYAGDYVESMKLIMNHSQPDEFVVATGKKHSIQDIVRVVVKTLGITKPISDIIELDQNLKRPQDIKCLVGNANKISRELGWRPKKSFENLISEMAVYDFNSLKQ